MIGVCPLNTHCITGLISGWIENWHPNHRLVVQNGNLELRRNIFTHRVVNKWDNLNQSVKTAASLNEFKNKYDAILD